MKTITMYELLGLVKDGKAPKKIKYREMIYHICYEYGDYESDIEEYRFADIKQHYYLFEGIDMLKCLNDEVEILEEEPRNIEVCGSLFTKSEYDNLFCCEEEKKIPEKINKSYNIRIFDLDKPHSIKGYDMEQLIEMVQDIYSKQADIIDYLNNKGDE